MDDDPTIRRRFDREAMIRRDEEVWRRKRAGESFRQIGRSLGMAASSVQRCLARAQKSSGPQRWLSEEPGGALARVDDLGLLRVDDLTYSEDCEKLNELEFYRLRFFPMDSPQRRALAAWTPSDAWRSAHPEPEMLSSALTSAVSGNQCDE